MTEPRRTAAVSPHRAALERFYAAEVRYIAAGGAQARADFSDVAAHFHPDVVVRQGPTVPYSGEWCGIGEIEKFFEIHSRTWSSLELSQTEYFYGGDGVAISLRMRAVARLTGIEVDTRIGHFIIFDHGLIRDFTVFYLDPVQVSSATRL